MFTICVITGIFRLWHLCNNPRRLICEWLIGLGLHGRTIDDRSFPAAADTQCLDGAPQAGVDRMARYTQLARNLLGGRMIVDKVKAFSLAGSQPGHTGCEIHVCHT